jgi:hypothetical protein
VAFRVARLTDAGAIHGMWSANDAKAVQGPFALLPAPSPELVGSLFTDMVSVLAVDTLTGELCGFISANSPGHAMNSDAPPLRQALAEYPLPPGAFMFGPVCVTARYRGSGLFEALYGRIRDKMAGREGAQRVR